MCFPSDVIILRIWHLHFFVYRVLQAAHAIYQDPRSPAKWRNDEPKLHSPASQPARSPSLASQPVRELAGSSFEYGINLEFPAYARAPNSSALGNSTGLDGADRVVVESRRVPNIIFQRAPLGCVGTQETSAPRAFSHRRMIHPPLTPGSPVPGCPSVLFESYDETVVRVALHVAGIAADPGRHGVLS